MAKFRWHFLLVLASLAFLAVLEFTLQVTAQHLVYNDSTTYIEAASNLYNGFAPHEFRPMLIAAVHGFPLLFGFSEISLPNWSIFVNVISWLGIIVMLFEILRSFLPQKKAFLFAMLYVICAGSAVLNFFMLADTVFSALLFATLFFLWKYTSTKQYFYLPLAIGILILSLLVKPAGRFLVIIAVICFSTVLLKKAFRKSNAFFLFSVLLLCGQMISMKERFGNYTVSYIDSFTYYNYLGTRADCLKNGTEYKQCDNARFENFIKLGFPEQKIEAANDFGRQLSGNFPNLVKAYFIDLYINSTNASTAVIDCQNVNGTPYFNVAKLAFKALAKLQILFFSLAGFVLGIYYLLRFNRVKKVFFTAAVGVVYVMGISGVSSDQGDRFHLVVYPMIILLLAKFLSDRWKFFA